MEPVETLYRLYHMDIYRYLFSLTHDAQLAEDLLSDTFLRALLKLPSFRGEASVKTWLFGIARNVWLQHLRKQGHQQALKEHMLLELTGEPASAEELFLQKELFDKVMKLLDTREERARSIVLMRAAGHDFSEIAEAWGISENSARVTDFRTRKWLREQLGSE